MAPANDLRSRVDSFVADLNDLIRKSALDAVRSALGVTAKRGPGRPRGAGRARAAGAPARKGKRVRRDTGAVMALAGRVHTAIKQKPGMSVEQIGAAMKLPTKALALPIKKLIAAKQVKTKGQRRGTRYFSA